MLEPEVKQDLRETAKRLTELRGLFDLDHKLEAIGDFEEKMGHRTSGTITNVPRRPSPNST